MKRTYEAPTLIKREQLAAVTAGGVSLPASPA